MSRNQLYYMAKPSWDKSERSDWFFLGLDFTIRTVFMEAIKSRVFFWFSKAGEREIMNYSRTVLGKIGPRSFLRTEPKFNQQSVAGYRNCFKKLLLFVPLKGFIYFSVFPFYLQLALLTCNKKAHCYEEPVFRLGTKFCSGMTIISATCKACSLFYV